MSDDPVESQILLYEAADGRARLEVRFEGESAWLTQAAIASLYETSPQNITQHIAAVLAEGELDESRTCKSYLQVRTEGERQVRRSLMHYNLAMVLAVGYRVRSPRGTLFRQWATAHLEEYVVKGFAIDDQRLKNPGQLDYFDELLARIRDIRSTEKVFYKKVLEIYATSIDYSPRSDTSQLFFKTVQNKMHWAAHGHTAAEVIVARANAELPNMGLTSWAGAVVRKQDVVSAKNYLAPDELEALNRIVNAYLEFAELQAMNRKTMTMAAWLTKLDDFLRLSDREILTHAGSIAADVAREAAQSQYTLYEHRRQQLPTVVETHFDEAVATMKRRTRPSPKQ